MGEDKVISMAVVAGSGDDKPPLEQAFPVDTFGIVVQDVFLRDIVDPGDRGSLPVALAAKGRDFHFIGVRLDIVGRQDGMVSMALCAGRGVGSAPLEGFSVDSGEEFLIGFGMTGATIHLLQALGMREVFSSRVPVTGDAFDIPVDGR